MWVCKCCRDMCVATVSFWSAQSVPERVWQKTKCGGVEHQPTQANFTQYDITAHIKQLWKLFWTDVRENILVLISQNHASSQPLYEWLQILPFSLHSFLALMQAIISTQFQNVFWDVSCGIIMHCRLPSCHWATISLCGCLFLRVCTTSSNSWSSRGNNSKAFSVCKCTRQEQVRLGHWEQCVCEWDFVFLHMNVSSCALVHDRLKKAKCNASASSIRCRFVTGTTSGPPIRRSLHLRLCITWVASMWRTTWWPQQMTSSGTGECKPAFTFG